jgi:hypothetical protein
MYSHTFCFTFARSVPPAARMRFLAALFEIPEQIGERANDIYWYRFTHTGKVVFNSNNPSLTDALFQRLEAAEADGVITLMSYETPVVPAFLSWAASGLRDAADRALKPRRRH